jgi:hypothetical protein
MASTVDILPAIRPPLFIQGAQHHVLESSIDLVGYPVVLVHTSDLIGDRKERRSSKYYIRIQPVPHREHHTSPLQRSAG